MSDRIDTLQLRDGVRLVCHIRGEGQPLILLGGLGMAPEAWEHYYGPRLRQAGFQTITYSPRGMAPSTVPPPPYTVDELAQDCADVIDSLGLSEVCLLGTSLGSLTAQETACVRPEQVARLCLLGTWARQTEWLRTMVRGERELFERASAGPEQWIPRQYHLAMLLLKYFPAEELQNDDLVKQRLALLEQGLNHQDAGRLGLMTAGIHYDNRLERLRGIRAETLILAFEKDVLMPPLLGREVAEAIPQARFEVIPGAAHLGVFTHSKVILRTLLGFLGRASAQG